MDEKKRTVSIYLDKDAERDYNFLRKTSNRSKNSVSRKLARGMELAALEEALHIHLSAGVLFALAEGKLDGAQCLKLDSGTTEIVISEDIYKEDDLAKRVRSWLDERVVDDGRGCRL